LLFVNKIRSSPCLIKNWPMVFPTKEKDGNCAIYGKDSRSSGQQVLKYRSVTDIVRPIREIVRRREEATRYSVRHK
jgi:hypothetical protein